MKTKGIGDMLSAQDVCAATGINRYTFRRVRRWLFLEPSRDFPGRGSTSYYAAVAVPMIRRFMELQQGTRKVDDCVWRLWLEGFPIDMCKWADARLAPVQKVLGLAERLNKIRQRLASICSCVV